MTSALEECQRNLRLALDLFEVGEAMKRQNLRRENPNASDEEIEAMLNEWMLDRPSLADVPGFRLRTPSE